MGFIVVDESTYDIELSDDDRSHVWLHAMQLDRREALRSTSVAPSPGSMPVSQR